MNETAIQIAYLVATALFIFSLKWMNDPQTARRGVLAGVAAMLLAVIGTLLNPEILTSNYKWIAIAVILGTVIGVPLSWVPLTAVPSEPPSPTRLAVWPPGWWASRNSTAASRPTDTI